MATASTASAPQGATERSPKANKALGVGLAVVSGLAMAVQGRVNGQLGSELHDSMLAAVISFGGGLLVLLVVLSFSPKMRLGLRKLRDAVRNQTLRPWHLLGGFAGATFVAGQSITVPILGVAMFTVGAVAGQTVSGLFVDRAGLGPAGPQPLTPLRVFGALLTLAAVGGSLSGGFGSHGAGLWLLALPLVAGVLMAVQQAYNGRVGATSGSAMTATLVNFVTGLSVLLLGWVVSLVLRGGPTAFPHNPVLYLGGLVGILFIALASFVVEWIGVLLLGLSAIAGQLIGAVLLDVFVPAHGEHLATATLVGAAIALVAVGIALVPTLTRAPR
ncbi:DMT family transporter [Amycolatopsis sp.]|uniref:DMT family transporter n=1 Tax=Amycolatopsis sp. TaxID=37632 RepID=UPI002DF947DE|nr:DMT family transporter [Amycolatopsis sp.]